MSEREARAATGHLRAVLDEVEAGRLVCSAATRHRLEGAVLALDAAVNAGLDGDEIQALTDVPR